ncbi:MAG: glycosyltransferase [Proteobacteria bacterium]|nr:MAG: glycosyltransferase [Pseudomonadota bacterium]
MPVPSLSIIVPVLNEAAGIASVLAPLQALRGRSVELIVVDGGSTDGTAALAAPLCEAVIAAPRGRASQMNAGAGAAQANRLLFLHADTRLPDGAIAAIHDALADHAWGRFDVRIDGRHPMLKVVAAMMNLRSRLTGIATGDQAIFARRDAFTKIGGFADLPLMEDIAFSRSMKSLGRPACLRLRVTTAGRRWERHGVFRTIALMWRLRAAYALGTDPAELARRYGYTPRES